MNKLTLIFLFLLGCSALRSGQNDQIERILELKKANDPRRMTELLGKPEKIESSDPILDAYYFPKKDNEMPFKVFVNRKERSIETVALTFWVNFDAYDYLKKRFKRYKWLETPIPSKSVDSVEELYQVDIPELGITFQYNDQDPLRRPMWVFFK